MVVSNHENTGLSNIESMYKNLTYFDEYGATVLFVIFITFIVINICVYCYAKTHIKPIIDDWPNQRCKPYYIPIAGFITKPENTTAIDYTMENFSYCAQNILSRIMGYVLEAITFITNLILSIINDARTDINLIRALINKIRLFFQSISEEIMGRIMNIMIPLQKIVISFRDMLSKVQGILTAGLYTLLGSYYALQALMGAIAEFVIIILIALLVLILIFWIFPFTWTIALSMTAIFIAISIPLVLILVFMLDVLNVQPDLSIPALQCFDKDTNILMKDGTYKQIKDICIGDQLYYDGIVTARMKLKTEGSIMYVLNDVIVSDTHLVHYKGKWLRVREHPDAKKIDEYNEPYLYCLNTTSKTIYINNTLFSDWDEVVGDDFTRFINNVKTNITKTNITKTNSVTTDEQIKSSEIHELLDSGFSGSTLIILKNNIVKQIKNIEICDILLNGEKVLGVVEIDGKKIKQQYQYILGKNTFIKGGPNIVINKYDEKQGYLSTLSLSEGKHKRSIQDNEDKLFHLITNTKTFYINEVEFYDYNKSIDIFLEKV